MVKKQTDVRWTVIKRNKQGNNWINEDELGKKIMKKCVRIRAKTYSYLIDYGSEDKKKKGTKSAS